MYKLLLELDLGMVFMKFPLFEENERYGGAYRLYLLEIVEKRILLSFVLKLRRK